MDFGKSYRVLAAHDTFQTSERFVIEQRRVYTFELRQISGELLQSFAELALGAGWIGLLVMIEADGQMNDTLQE